MRFGLIGLGQMGRHHARILSESDEVEFVGAVDPMGDRHRAMRRGDIFDDVESLLRAGIEAAVVAVPTAQHHELALQLADANVNMLIEKPLAENVEAGLEIREQHTFILETVHHGCFRHF